MKLWKLWVYNIQIIVCYDIKDILFLSITDGVGIKNYRCYNLSHIYKTFFHSKVRGTFSLPSNHNVNLIEIHIGKPLFFIDDICRHFSPSGINFNKRKEQENSPEESHVDAVVHGGFCTIWVIRIIYVHSGLWVLVYNEIRGNPQISCNQWKRTRKIKDIQSKKRTEGCEIGKKGCRDILLCVNHKIKNNIPHLQYFHRILYLDHTPREFSLININLPGSTIFTFVTKKTIFFSESFLKKCNRKLSNFL